MLWPVPWPFALFLPFFFVNIRIRIDVELPPAKRRRTLAGSIVSTALSAALIGTAVGLTVYRLLVDSTVLHSRYSFWTCSWRDRGSDNALPPSYQESERSQQVSFKHW